MLLSLPESWVARQLHTALTVTVGLLSLVGSAVAMPLGPAPSTQTLQLVIPLVADDAGLQRFARAVSTPGSPHYGDYQPVSLLARRFGAPASVQHLALRFLAAAGARDLRVNPSGMFAEATMTVAAAERTFGTQLARFQARGGGTFVAPAVRGRASAAVPLPAGLRGVATGIVGLDTRPVLRHPAVALAGRGSLHGPSGAHAAAGQPPSGYLPRTGTPRGCSSGVASGGFTPNQYLSAYGYTPLRQAGLAGKGERVALLEIDGFKYSDIRTYAQCFGLHLPRLSVFFVDSRRARPAGGEATLDLEVLNSAAPSLDAIQVYENAGNAAAVTRSLVLPLVTPGAKPQVVSASLGLCEPDMVTAFGRGGIAAFERDLELAAATGITVVASSGDNGSAACVDARGRSTAQLAVNYPASSPWITAVGGTNVRLTPSNTIQQQIVWNDTTVLPAAAGGGFSDVFRRPSYQQRVVGPGRRAVPDISMLADLAPGYAVYCTATSDPSCAGVAPWHSVGGTSAAAPLLAAGVALVDQDLHRHGRELLGFINPLLYAVGSSSLGAAVFSDVTAFGNDVGPYLRGGHGQPLGCCSAGTGFDAASGWGSLNLAALDLAAQRALSRSGEISVSIPSSQQPLRHGALRVRLYCSQQCRAYAFVLVTIGSSSRFTARSALLGFRGRGTRIVPIRFSSGQVGRMRAGLAAGRRIDGEVFAVAAGTGGQPAKVTAGRMTRITD